MDENCSIYIKDLTAITTCDQAARWATQAHEYANIYHDWMNEKTYTTDPLTQHRHWSWTHEHTRKAYNSLNYLWRNNLLFVYPDPPATVVDAKRVKATTNSLEGGVSSALKLLTRNHRGRGGEHQRKMLEWWLYMKTELPDDPIDIARQQRWGQDALAKVSTLSHNKNHADQETGRPALYDNAIPTDYQHTIGIRKGTIS